MRDIDEVFAALGRSRFRSRFRLGEKEAEYLEAKGLEVIIAVLQRWLVEDLS